MTAGMCVHICTLFLLCFSTKVDQKKGMCNHSERYLFHTCNLFLSFPLTYIHKTQENSFSLPPSISFSFLFNDISKIRQQIPLSLVFLPRPVASPRRLLLQYNLGPNDGALDSRRELHLPRLPHLVR